MTAPTPAERAEAERILGKCSCLEDYTLRKLTDPNCHWCEHGEDVMELIRERDKWKNKFQVLGNPKEWFPGLLENDMPGPTTTKARAELLIGFCKIFGFNKEQQEAVDQFASGIFEGIDELQLQARSLLEKARTS